MEDSTIKFLEKEKIIRYTHFIFCVLESSVCDNPIKIQEKIIFLRPSQLFMCDTYIFYIKKLIKFILFLNFIILHTYKARKDNDTIYN